MKKIVIAFALIVCFWAAAYSQNWDVIRNSGEYYYGIGVGPTEPEADQAAMANLISQIATNVSSDFTQIDDMSVRNGDVNHKSRVLSCVQTYSQATLTNTQKWSDTGEGKAPRITQRRFIKKSELFRIFQNRIAKAKDLSSLADECLKNRNLDMALQYYYWAYSLIRSVQFPNEVKDDNGKLLIDWIPAKIERILNDISVTFDKKDGDYIDLLFKYKGQPVSSLEFSYSDGRTPCQGLAKDGRGMIEMIPGYETDFYHLDIEYQYKSQARGDAEMESVLKVITPKVFPKAAIKVKAKGRNAAGNSDPVKAPAPVYVNVAGESDGGKTGAGSSAQGIGADVTAASNIKKVAQDSVSGKIPAEPVAAVPDSIANAIEGIIDSFNNRSYMSAHKYFTVNGLSIFNRLTGYGKARVLDTSNIKYYKGLNGQTVVRGLKMSFSFDGRRKKTFVEDLSFTFDKDNKIDNVAFGLGDLTQNAIFNSKAQWSEKIREIIVSFMENYKTAYSLERLDYLRDIFADDALIIVGNVVRRNPQATPTFDGKTISLKGQDVIKYNRYTKDQYLNNLARSFNRNDFINLKFSNHEIQWLEKFDKEQIFAINIRQEYNSSTYSDTGYLFLLVDMTDSDKPLIKVRTWQPNEVSLDRLYKAGDFFND